MKIIHWFVPLFAEQHNLYLEINLNDACNIVAVATQGWRAFQWLLWMGAPCLLICSDLSNARHLGHNRSTIAVVCVFNVILAYFSDFSCVSTFDWPIRQWSVQLAFWCSLPALLQPRGNRALLPEALRALKHRGGIEECQGMSRDVEGTTENLRIGAATRDTNPWDSSHFHAICFASKNRGIFAKLIQRHLLIL